MPSELMAQGGAGPTQRRRAARPQLMRAWNEQLLLEQVRKDGPSSRGNLARISGLSAPTVGRVLTGLEGDGLVRVAGHRTGSRGPAAVLYEIRPEAAFVLGLDVGLEFIRGAVADLSGTVRAKDVRKARGSTARSRLAEMAALGDSLTRSAGLRRSQIAQTVIGSPGVYDPGKSALTMVSNIPGWGQPLVLAELLRRFGDTTVIENDVNAAALAERDKGHGRRVDSFAFVSVGTGTGMGLVIDGQIHRGAHGAAGEIAFLPMNDGRELPVRPRRRGAFETAASAAAVVRAARSAGVRGNPSARRIFRQASAGDVTAQKVVKDEATLIARALCAIIAVVDPPLIVLGGGIGRAPGFADAVASALAVLAPVVPEIRVSALGDDAVVEGCLAAGIDSVWRRVLERA